MKTTPALLCAVLAAASLVQAQEVKPAQAADAPAAAAVPAAPMDKVSYFIGKSVGGQFAQQKDKIDMKEFIEGVKDAMSSKKSTSYMAGNGLGQQFSSEQIAIDVEKLAAGITAATTPGAKPEYTEEELSAAMGLYEKAMRAKQEANMPPEERAAIAKQKADAAARTEKGKTFLADNGKRKGVTTTASGLQYEVIKAGDGPKPVATDKVSVHYHGTLVDGKVFDSSVERGMPITFGVQEVIKGWTEALQLMPVGSKWKIYIPSQLAYGESGAGSDIGPNESLIFEVELLGIVK